MPPDQPDSPRLWWNGVHAGLRCQCLAVRLGWGFESPWAHGKKVVPFWEGLGMALLRDKKINHVALVIDASGSIADRRLTDPIIQVVDSQVEWLSKLSTEMDQETRVSIYLFGERNVTCVVFDTDVLRLPSLKGHYRPYGGTPLMSGVAKAISDLKQTAQMYGDHGFIVMAFTDGEENTSHISTPQVFPAQLKAMINELSDNWTIACLVPDSLGKMRATSFGFDASNVAIWNTTKDGVAEMGEEVKAATSNYFVARSTGVQTKTGLFSTVQANTVTQAQVDASKMTAVDPNDFMIIPVALSSSSKLEIKIPNRSKTKKNPDGIKHVEIQSFVEETGRPYVTGNAYYRLTKSERYFFGKGVALVHRTTRKVYRGPEAEALIGLKPETTRIQPPAATDEYEVYVRSTSFNRQVEVGGSILLFNR